MTNTKPPPGTETAVMDTAKLKDSGCCRQFRVRFHSASCHDLVPSFVREPCRTTHRLNRGKSARRLGKEAMGDCT
eukprot:3959761-Pyramimonas_sp.AAC.1